MQWLALWGQSRPFADEHADIDADRVHFDEHDKADTGDKNNPDP
jgi:hypothetical protein